MKFVWLILIIIILLIIAWIVFNQKDHDKWTCSIRLSEEVEFLNHGREFVINKSPTVNLAVTKRDNEKYEYNYNVLNANYSDIDKISLMWGDQMIADLEVMMRSESLYSGRHGTFHLPKALEKQLKRKRINLVVQSKFSKHEKSHYLYPFYILK